MGFKLKKSLTEKLKEAKDLVGESTKIIGNTSKNFIGESTKILSDSSKNFIETLYTKSHARELAAKDKSYNSRLKKYNPLFLDEYASEEFNIPNMIRIVDDAVRKGIDVCEGSIGWISNEKGVEIFHLYDEAINLSDIKFIPAPVVDSIYFVDPLDRNNYISIENYHSYVQQSKIAELQHIAFLLGAKHYKVEMIDTTDENHSKKLKASIKSKLHNADMDSSMDSKSYSGQKSLAEGNFSNSNRPQLPTLKWFINDENIKNLINMRCTESLQSSILDYAIELTNSSSANMSMSMAANIKTVAYGFGIKSNFEEKSKKDTNSKLLYYLEF